VVIARAEVEHHEAFSRAVTFDHLHSNQVFNEGLKHLERDKTWDEVFQLAGSIFEKPL